MMIYIARKYKECVNRNKIYILYKYTYMYTNIFHVARKFKRVL